MIQAKWIDQALFEPAFINGNWLVHSVFQHSFNLQDPRQDQLICVSKQAARVPKGMILAADDYAALATGLVAGTTLLVQQRVVIFRIIVCLFKRQPNLQRPFRLAQSHLIENCFGQSFKTSRKRRGFKKLFQQPSAAIIRFMTQSISYARLHLRNNGKQSLI